MAILICTSSVLADRHVPRVVEGIRARGQDVFELDTARFPVDTSLSLDTEGGTLRQDDRALSLGQVTAAWNTHGNIAESLDARVHPDYRDAVRIQSDFAWGDVLGALSHAFQLDPRESLMRFPLGLRHLSMAKAAGLDVPRTLLTNDPASVRAFARDHGGTIIAKMLHSSVVQKEGPRGPTGYAPQLVGEAELRTIDRVALCPMLFQERIPKAIDVRITVVGSRLFAGAVDSSRADVVDWADLPELVRGFRPVELPGGIATSVLTLMDTFGLNFGTVDFIKSTEGRWVYLETNPISFYDFLEDATDLPISAAIADLLTGRAEPRVFS